MSLSPNNYSIGKVEALGHDGQLVYADRPAAGHSETPCLKNTKRIASEK